MIRLYIPKVGVSGHSSANSLLFSGKIISISVLLNTVSSFRVLIFSVSVGLMSTFPILLTVAVVMVGIRFKMMVVMVRDMRKDEFETDLENNYRYNDTDISFNIYVPD